MTKHRGDSDLGFYGYEHVWPAGFWAIAAPEAPVDLEDNLPVGS